MKNLITLVFLFFLVSLANGQSVLTLSDCYERAEANYPLIRQSELIRKTTSFAIENAVTGNLPQIMIGGQATYQSDVTRIPVEMPGVEPLSKDQYKIFGEIAQTLYHGGLVAEQKQSVEIGGQIDTQELEVDLYQIKDRINGLFFGILFLQEQTRLNELIRRDLNARLKKTKAAIANGSAIPSEADALRAEMLKVDQRIIETESAERTHREVLGAFISQPIAEAVLERPRYGSFSTDINRPEVSLLDLQSKSIQSNLELLRSQKKPRVQLFVQGGYGRPGLNMLENQFDFYYVAGIRFNWSISAYYTFRREKEILTLQQQSLDARKETFLFNTDLAARQQKAEIAKLRRLISADDEIIALRAAIRRTAEVQLDEGVISSTDFIREVNAEHQAKQNRALHETQLLMAQAKLQFTFGPANK